MVLRITEKNKWRGTSDQFKRDYLSHHLEKITGERVDPYDSFIVFAVDFVDIAYNLNITYENRKAIEIFESLLREDLR